MSWCRSCCNSIRSARHEIEVSPCKIYLDRNEPQFPFINCCFRQLISQIEAFKQTSILTSESDAKEQSAKADKATEPNILKYQLMYLPEKARMQEAARIALLEQRLCNLESVIGTTSEKLSKFSQVRYLFLA